MNEFEKRVLRVGDKVKVNKRTWLDALPLKFAGWTGQVIETRHDGDVLLVCFHTYADGDQRALYLWRDVSKVST